MWMTLRKHGRCSGKLRIRPATTPVKRFRLYQELLNEFPFKLIPVSEAASDHFKAVRSRVLTTIRGDQTLLDRYRLIQNARS